MRRGTKRGLRIPPIVALDPRDVERRSRRVPLICGVIAAACVAGAVAFAVAGVMLMAALALLGGVVMAASARMMQLSPLARGHWYLADGETRLDGVRAFFWLLCLQVVAAAGVLVVVASWRPVVLVAILAALSLTVTNGALRSEAGMAWRGAFGEDLPQLRLSPTDLAILRPGFEPWTIPWNYFHDARLIAKRGLELRGHQTTFLFPTSHGFPVGTVTLIELLTYYKENPRDRYELRDERALARIAAWEAEGEAAAA